MHTTRNSEPSENENARFGDVPADAPSLKARSIALSGLILLVLFASGVIWRRDIFAPPETGPSFESEGGEFAERDFVRLPDKFPALIDPDAVAVADVALEDTREVLGISMDGGARAYEITTVAFHHVINDRLANQDLVVTYCWTCSSGIAFDRHVDGEVLTFGVHGLWKGSLLLYDKETGSTWQHISGRCIEGPLKGKQLKPIPVRHTTWSDWKRQYPIATAVLQVPEHRRMYRTPDRLVRGSLDLNEMFLQTMTQMDERLPLEELCFGVRVGKQARAYRLVDLAKADEGLISDTVDGVSIIVAFDTESMSASAFLAGDAAAPQNFRRSPEGLLKDTETGCEYDLDGHPTSGSCGEVLVKPYSLQTEWYGWSSNWPDTDIWKGDESAEPQSL